jgi:hypothetical protein
MKLRYLVVDDQCCLRLVRRRDVEALWKGRRAAADLGCSAEREIRLVSVLCNERLVPHKIFLLRLPLTKGQFTRENWLTLRIFTMRDCVTSREMIEHHTEGWPRDFFTQLAVAFDVPRRALDVPLGIGGPLLTAAAMRVTPKQALRYLQ